MRRAGPLVVSHQTERRDGWTVWMDHARWRESWWHELLGAVDGHVEALAVSRHARTAVLNLPADIYPTGSVASVSGMSGTGAGIGTILATYATGVVADRYSFEPILIAASLIPLGATLAVVALVRNTRETDQGIVNRI